MGGTGKSENGKVTETTLTLLLGESVPKARWDAVQLGTKGKAMSYTGKH